jgi:phosphate starvation-inducible protein PhoH and related proteins
MREKRSPRKSQEIPKEQVDERIVKSREKFQRKVPVLKPLTESQATFLTEIDANVIGILSGSAGTGKSYLACYKGSTELTENTVQKIILIRAYQPLANRGIGFLPGSLEEKLLPYYQQMLDYLAEFLGKANVELYLKNGKIEICSLETIRGRSWSNAFVICEEAQNLYVSEIQALVTRIGEGTKMLFAGDDTGSQTDITNSQTGLNYLESVVQKNKIKNVLVVKFTENDIVRSGIVKDFVIAFNKENNKGSV